MATSSAIEALALGSAKPLLHRRIAFEPARSAGARFNAAGTTLGAGDSLGDYEVHIVRAKVAAAGEAAEAAEAAGASAAPAAERVCPFQAYLPEGSLYADAHEGGWSDAQRWRTVARVGPGFSNMGNTCFLNSVLQCLTYLPPLAQLCLEDAPRPGRPPLPSIAAAAAEAAAALGSQDRFCALDTIVRHMRGIHVGMLGSAARQRAMGRRTAVAPALFVRNLRKISGSSMRVGRQHDAHEFLRLLVDAMQKSCALAAGLREESTDRKLETSFVMRIFGGYTESRVSCGSEGCSTTSSSFEPFMDLSLDIADQRVKSLRDALNVFVAREELSGEACWDCPSCGKVPRAFKQMAVRRAPVVLVLHLKRFGFGTRGRKLSKVVSFETALELPAAEGPVQYQLTGLVVHQGPTMNLGHYVSFIKASNGTWYEMDDEVVRQVSVTKLLAMPAYLLFYTRVPSAETDNEGPAASSAVAAAEANQEEEQKGADEGADEDGEDVGVPVSSNAALAAFASRFADAAQTATSGEEEEGEEARQDLFGDFLTAREDAKDEAAEVNGLPVVPPGPWKHYFSSIPMRTSRAARQRHIDHIMKKGGVAKVMSATRFRPRASGGNDDKENVATDGSVLNDLLDSDVPEEPLQYEQRDDGGEDEGEDEEVVREAAMSLAFPDGDKSKSKKSRPAKVRLTQGDEVVLMSNKARSRPNRSEGKEAWLNTFKTIAKENKKRKNAKREQSTYDSWDAALDQGKQKKVKMKMDGDEGVAKKKKSHGNAFQKAQNKANTRELKRRSLA